MSTDLKKYGLSPRFEQEATLYDGLFIARVSQQHHDLYNVICENGEIQAEVTGKMMYEALDAADFPAVGDWVMIDRIDRDCGNAIIHNVLSRKSMFGRKAAGTHNDVQVIAANIDTVFICMSLNEDFNLRRLERYLSVALDSMANPVIVLTKSDLCDDLPARLAEVSTVKAGADIVVCSSIEATGYDSVLNYISVGSTIVFIGSSGVGKSTLINKLAGEDIFKTKEIRQDDGKGRHTTTHRQLLLLPQGGVVIDTPGMRELHLDSADLSKSFADVEALAAKCKFGDCSHSSEPGCAVRTAIENGELSENRYENYKKLQLEISYKGLNSRQIDQLKIKRMFGGKNEMKRFIRKYKDK